MKSPAKPDVSASVAGCQGEPAERLEQRAVEGVNVGIAALKRLRRRLPAWLRPDGQPDVARAIAVLAGVQTALATLSPINLARLTKRIRRQRTETK